MRMYQQIDRWERIVDHFVKPENGEINNSHYPILAGDSFGDLEIGEYKQFTGTTILKRIA